MNKNFEEHKKKAKGGIRLAREKVFKLVFGVETSLGNLFTKQRRIYKCFK